MFVHVRAFTHIHPRPFPLFAPFSSCSEFSTGKFGCRYATTAAGCHLTNGAGWNTANCGSGGTDCKLTTLTTTAVAITGGKRRREKKSVLYYAVCCAVCEGISVYLCVLLTRSTTPSSSPSSSFSEPTTQLGNMCHGGNAPHPYVEGGAAANTQAACQALCEAHSGCR